MLPEVAEGRGAQQRVGNRVTHDIAVGMPDQSVLALERHATEPQRPMFGEPVDVEAQTRSAGRHQASRPPIRASARARSSIDVILKFRGSPGIATTEPTCSSSIASSVTS